MKHANDKRSFGRPFPTTLTVSKDHTSQHRRPFQPLPVPTGPAPYHLSLDTILSRDRMAKVNQEGKIIFHTTGDTGGIESGIYQEIVARYMHNDLHQSNVDFFYHLGDVVYFYGEAQNYLGEFYDPYYHYNAPIFAIPGNHDGDIAPGAAYRSLDAFKENFCAQVPQFTPEAGNTARQAMTQPNVYWVLDTPFATFIGLYTNVPEGGQLDDHQIAWFHQEMATAPSDKALIIAMHHPIYSLDTHHSGSEYMGGILDAAIDETKRVPDLVLAAHVHNYQRFVRNYNGKEIPYIVAGAGGYFHLHHQQKHEDGDRSNIQDLDVTLKNYCDDRWGFLRLEVSKDTISGKYLTVPLAHETGGTSGEDQPLDQGDKKFRTFDTFNVQIKKLAGATP